MSSQESSNSSRGNVEVGFAGASGIDDFDEIEIISGVRGLIVVGWYSGIAKKSIDKLKPLLGDLEVRLFTNTL